MNPAVLWAVIGEGLKVVETLLEHGTTEAVTRAREIIVHLIDGHSGRVLPEDVAQALEDLRSEIAATDTEADAALRAKFHHNQD